MTDPVTPGPCECYQPIISGPGSLLYSWSPHRGDEITTYKFQYTQEGVSQTVDISGENTSYEVSNLIIGVDVNATIKASNDNGETWGPEAAFPTAIAIDIPPAPPESATLSFVPNTRCIKVDWTLPAELPLGNSYYVVNAEPVTGQEGTKYSYTSNGFYDLSYTFISLSQGITYYFTLKTVNEAGESQPLTTDTIEVPIIPYMTVIN
jgi:hypothetical protein